MPEGYVVPKGKLSLELAQDMLLDYAKDPQANNAGALSVKYNIKVADVEALAENFKIFTHLKNTGVPLTEKEIADMKDPYRAQPDWVIEAGEIPPKMEKEMPSLLEISLGEKTMEKKQEPPKILTKGSLKPDREKLPEK